MAGLSVSGLGSGMDIDGLVRQLVAAERQPVANRLNRQEFRIQTEISALGMLQSSLSSLKSSLAGLSDPAKFQAFKATPANSDLLSASATSEASPGTYKVEVKQLAGAQKLASDAFSDVTDTVGSGTLTFRFGRYDSDLNTFVLNADKSTKTVTIDPAKNTLADVRDAINDADIGVRASLINDGSGQRLVVGPIDSGADNSLEITVNDDDGNHTDASGLSRLAFDPTQASGTGKNMQQTMAAQDALLVVDGLDVSSPKNELSEVIKGVTLNLKSADVGNPTDLTVSRDTASVTSAVSAFINGYNEYVGTLKTLTGYDADTRQGGPLLGDAMARSIAGSVSRLIGEPVPGADPALNRLSHIGVSVQRDGTLKLDSDKLKTALETDSQAVAHLFSSDNGVAKRMESFLEAALDENGGLDSRSDRLTSQLGKIDDQREDLGRRMTAVEARYKAQFTAMDGIISRLTATSSFLTQQLESLANMNNIKSK